MKEASLRSKQFSGMARNTSEVMPTLDVYLTDQGGNHETHGVWAVRRGAEHTGWAKKAAAVTAMAGLKTLAGTVVYAVVAGTTFYSES